jgi:hypothetical protein
MDWLDCQSSTHPQRSDVIAAAVLCLGFGSIPFLVRWLCSVTNLWWVSMPDDISWQSWQLPRVFPYQAFWPFCFQIAELLGFAFLCIALVGRTLGPIFALAAYPCELWMEGHNVLPVLFHPFKDFQAHYSFIDAVFPVTVMIFGLAAFRASESGCVLLPAKLWCGIPKFATAARGGVDTKARRVAVDAEASVPAESSRSLP